ncbi:hypothetical protein [Brevundimonas naejangsanensis]|uniref:hypothetical protein n=1 Tax=Brevundimonas naejangsanensis TaxID=588932 RepID=UPI003CFD6C71
MDDQASGGREKDWHEEAPRIIASGRWEQDEYGDTTYIPDHVRPSTAERAEAADAPRGHYYEDPAPRDGYRVHPDATWAAARRDYLAGDTAEAVCDRYGLKLGTLRSRAAREGWRRCDAGDPDPWPDEDDPVEDAAADAPDLAAMAAQALMRLNRAVRRGRAAEAASWLRTWRALTDPTLLAAAEPESPPPAPEPDPLDTLEADMKAVAAVARDAARLAPDDLLGRRAVEARLAVLSARLAPEGEGAISDDSDELDSVFPDPSPLEGEGGP